MKKSLLFLFILSLSLNACSDEYNENLVPLIGVYDSHILGGSGPFDTVISLEDGDDVFIDTAWDGLELQVIKVEVENESDYIKYFDIDGRSIYGNGTIDGSGVYNEGSLQLDFKICIQGECIDYTLIGSKY